jgi:hypothetical protein
MQLSHRDKMSRVSLSFAGLVAIICMLLMALVLLPIAPLLPTQQIEKATEEKPSTLH